MTDDSLELSHQEEIVVTECAEALEDVAVDIFLARHGFIYNGQDERIRVTSSPVVEFAAPLPVRIYYKLSDNLNTYVYIS
jgi:hypothetical protein